MKAAGAHGGVFMDIAVLWGTKSLRPSRIFPAFRKIVVSRVSIQIKITVYRGADKSLARPTSRCILFHGENISLAASLVIYIRGLEL